MPRESAAQIPILAEAVSRGDGTWILKPRLPNDAEWLTVRQTAAFLNVGNKSVYKLLGVYLAFHRPLPNKILVSFHSAASLRQATLDSEFWSDKSRKKALREAVQDAMNKLVEASLQSGCTA